MANYESLLKLKTDIENEIGKIIIGQEETVNLIINSIICNGHTLLMGVPGLAKTLLITSLAKCLDLSFSRIQFTPDLMPSDITGSEILAIDQETNQREFKFIKGPVFANIVLADEINRTPPKTQASLLQAMQEHEVSVGSITHKLPEPFFVLATQNPIEQEGTYPLPEAQLDRFLFNIVLDYPTYEEELKIAEMTDKIKDIKLNPVVSTTELISFRNLIKEIPVAKRITEFVVELVRSSRPDSSKAKIAEYISWGAGPRASQYLLKAATINSVLEGRFTPEIEDVKKLAFPILRHRIIPNFRANAEGINSDYIINELLKNL